MKPQFPLVLVLLAAASWSTAQVPLPVVVEKGPHHRTWGRIQEVHTPRGPRYRTNNVFVELQTGLHRWDAGRQAWIETTPRLEPFQDGAVVRGLSYSVIFSPNLASAGAIDLQLPGGERLTGHLLGLAYTEGTDSVLVAEVTDCAGEIGGPDQNELTYRRAFTAYDIDVQYVVNRGRFSQNVVLKERLRSPLEYGLSEKAHLEVLTEWVAAPAPVKETRVLEWTQDGQPALTDDRIAFGSMQFADGRAFSLDAGPPSGHVRTVKSWETLRDEVGNLRTFLSEKVAWARIKSEMQKLPARQASASPARRVRSLPAHQAKRPTLRSIQFDARTAQMAAVRPERAFVLDFEFVVSASNFTFRGGTTYLVTNAVGLVGTTTIEGTSVIKSADAGSSLRQLEGQVISRTGPFQPAVFTSRHDDSVVNGSKRV